MKKYLMFGYDFAVVKNIINEKNYVDLILDHWDLLDDIPKIDSKYEKRIFVNDSTSIEDVLASLHNEYTEPKYDLVFSRYESTVVIASALSEIVSKENYLSWKTALKFRDKKAQKSCLQNVVKIADFQLINNVDDFEMKNLKINYPLISKPYNGAGTASTFLNKSEEDLRKNIKEYNNKNKRKILLEEYIQGEEYQIDGYIYNENIVYLVSKYGKPVINISNGFILNSITLNPLLNKKTYEELEPILKKVLQSLELKRSIFHMEFFKNSKDEWVFSECGARIGGALSNLLFEHTYNISLSEILYKLINKSPELIDLNFQVTDKYFGYSYIQPLSEKVKKLPGEKELKDKFLNLKNVIYEWNVGEELPNTSLNSVKRTGMVLVGGSSTQEVEQEIKKIYEFFEELKKGG